MPSNPMNGPMQSNDPMQSSDLMPWNDLMKEKFVEVRD